MLSRKTNTRSKHYAHFSKYFFAVLLLQFIAVTAQTNDIIKKPTSCDFIESEIHSSINVNTDKMFKAYDIDPNEIIKLENYLKDRSDCDLLKIFPELKAQIVKFQNYQNTDDHSFDLREENCSEINIDTSSMPKNNNQKDLPWCWAWSAIDLLSFLFKTPFSVYDAAIQTINNPEIMKILGRTKNDPIKERIGGNNPAALFSTIKNSMKGLCQESQFDLFGKNWVELNDLINEMLISNKPTNEIVCKYALPRNENFLDLSGKMINILKFSNPIDRTASFVDLYCSKRSILNNFTWGVLEASETPADIFIGAIDEGIARGFPISIAYDSELLFAGKNYKMNKADHFSTIVGRKYNKKLKQCEYLLRNSWGPENCQKTFSISCDENGNYKIPRTALKNNTTSLFAIEKIDK